mmetsp:Transcript_28719/g.65364  ORF Transcript_28719/g.65364 Transcript_28719/m.65364 type:complete len:870 (-) Transcript_28719:1-2610(-)
MAPPPALTTNSTTRICVKNMPPVYNEDKLKSLLTSSQPSLRITDCRILKTKDGRSRKIAFVGFRSPSQADLAVAYFDRSFAGTARLSVSLAFSKKTGPSASDYRPWSKHSVGSSRYAKLHNQPKDEPEKDEAEDRHDVVESISSEVDRKKEEFLSAMGVSTKEEGHAKKVSRSKFWSNDDNMTEENGRPTTHRDDGSEQDGSEDSDSGDSDSVSSDSDRGDRDNEESTGTKVPSDMDFLKSKQIKADELSEDDDSSSAVSSSDDSESDSSSSESEDEDNACDEVKSSTVANRSGQLVEANGNESSRGGGEASDQTQPLLQLADRLFVRNLPFTTTEEELHETFSHFGQINSVHIPVDDAKRNKGYAFVEFESKKDAKIAMESMDGEDFQGRLIHIMPAKPTKERALDENDPNLSYKEKQAIIRQKEAEKTTIGWSATFLRGDAVVDNISDRLGVTKGDVLNVKDGISSGNAAVRLALGETHIISENVSFFKSHGVDVKALEASGGKSTNGVKRSKTMILVKNLPYDTLLEDLTKVFHGIGGDVPQRILLPPSKSAALVEYGHAVDARRAFRRLSYKKFKHVPLYLEWAPMDEEFDRSVSGQSETQESRDDPKRQTHLSANERNQPVDEDPANDAADVGTSQAIYVKNLNFATSEVQLRDAFSQAGLEPRAVKIPTKAAPSRRNASDGGEGSEVRQLSMGFGFVEFSSEDEALKAIKKMQGKLVDGHSLEIKLSTKSLSGGNSRAPEVDKSARKTKIMVRNVPFEATRSELLQLFGSFGQLKKVRLPKKFDGTHRGFAFCEFVTSKEARNAMTSLSQTHLYGRRLVLEWAEHCGGENEKADDARERAKRDVRVAGLNREQTRKKTKHIKF